LQEKRREKKGMTKKTTGNNSNGSVGVITQDLAQMGDQHCKKCGKLSGSLIMCPACTEAFKKSTGDGTMLREFQAEVKKDEAKAAKKAAKFIAKGGRVDMRSTYEIMWDDELTVKERAKLCEKLKLNGKIASKAWKELDPKDQAVIGNPKAVTATPSVTIAEKPSESANKPKGKPAAPQAAPKQKKVSNAAPNDTEKQTKLLNEVAGQWKKLHKESKIDTWDPSTWKDRRIATALSQVNYVWFFRSKVNQFSVGIYFTSSSNQQNVANMNECRLAMGKEASSKYTFTEHYGKSETAKWSKLDIAYSPMAQVSSKWAVDEMEKLYKLTNGTIAKLAAK
jgi:hypothetical protein